MNQMKKTFSAILITTALAFSVPVLAYGEGNYGGPNCGGPFGGDHQAGVHHRGGQAWTEQQKQDFRQYRAEQEKLRLNYMSKQLGITTAQQSAWNSYADSVIAIMTRRAEITPPNNEMPQSAILKYRASQAQAHAKSLNELSAAAAKLEATLTAEQKVRFSEMGGFGYGPHFRGNSNGAGGPNRNGAGGPNRGVAPRAR